MFFSVLRRKTENENVKISTTRHWSPMPRIVVNIIFYEEDLVNTERNEWCLSLFTCLQSFWRANDAALTRRPDGKSIETRATLIAITREHNKANQRRTSWETKSTG